MTLWNQRWPIRRDISEGELPPAGYGVARFNYLRGTTIYYPIPLNWIMRYGHLALLYLKTITQTRLERALRNVGRAARLAGYRQGQSDLINQLVAAGHDYARGVRYGLILSEHTIAELKSQLEQEKRRSQVCTAKLRQLQDKIGECGCGPFDVNVENSP